MSVARVEANPAAFFEQLYAIVVGLGLALALERVIDLDHRGIPILEEHVPLFLAYLNIAFALSHASVRYLQLAYGAAAVGSLSRGRVIADLVLGVGHFLLLMALPFLITSPTAFVYGALALLLGRPLRDGLLTIGKKQLLDFDKKVAVVHLATMTALIATLLIEAPATGSAAAWVLRFGGLVASLLFGLGLYVFAFTYFFPSSVPNN